MGDYHLSPPSYTDQQSNNHYNLSMLYCGFFVVATAGLIMAIYHCLALSWCSDYPPSWPGNIESVPSVSEGNFNARKVKKLESILYKYKKHQQDDEEEEECVVCLSVFEEGEDVRKLHVCKHSFHAPCIDMWLFSHFDCPLCRAPVGITTTASLSCNYSGSNLGSGSDFPNIDNSPV